MQKSSNGKRYKEAIRICQAKNQTEEKSVFSLHTVSLWMFAYVCSGSTDEDGFPYTLVYLDWECLVSYIDSSLQKGLYHRPFYE